MAARRRAPVAICSRCGRERPCRRASGPRPMCEPCAVSEGAEQAVCSSCGKVRRVAARSPAGPECTNCRAMRLRSRTTCSVCGARTRPSATDRSRCEPCAGERPAPACRRCGTLDLNYAHRLCARCVLGDRIAVMRADADSEPLARLDGFLTALAAGERPWSTLNWLQHGAGAPVLRELLQGSRELSHEALDVAGAAGVYLRAAFVEHGALAPRREADRITAAIEGELDRLPVGEDRTHLRALRAVASGPRPRSPRAPRRRDRLLAEVRAQLSTRRSRPALLAASAGSQAERLAPVAPRRLGVRRPNHARTADPSVPSVRACRSGGSGRSTSP
jgi:hypothetical protein